MCGTGSSAQLIKTEYDDGEVRIVNNALRSVTYLQHIRVHRTSCNIQHVRSQRHTAYR